MRRGLVRQCGILYGILRYIRGDDNETVDSWDEITEIISNSDSKEVLLNKVGVRQIKVPANGKGMTYVTSGVGTGAGR